MKNFSLVLALAVLISSSSFAVDIPGAITRTSEGLPTNTYEMMLSPSYTFEPAGAYLSSEVRYQPNEDFGAAVGFGAGEVGFNFGLNGTWYVLPDLGNQPSFSISAGAYFNRFEQAEIGRANYFNVRVLPMVSKIFRTNWGHLAPYAGATLTPSFRLSAPSNQFSMRAVLGNQIDIKDLDGLKIFAELNVALVNSVTEMALGVTYPFAALGN